MKKKVLIYVHRPGASAMEDLLIEETVNKKLTWKQAEEYVKSYNAQHPLVTAYAVERQVL